MTLAGAVYDYVEKNGLNKSFFEGRIDKAEVWVPESQKCNMRLNQKESFALVAPTGGGKTVIAQMGLVASPMRTLFLVPIRRLAKRHQKLFVAMGGKLQTRVITGETPRNEREWFDQNDRIIFATSHVEVVEELLKPNIISGFDRIVIDEMHNAASSTHPYSLIAKMAKQLDIPRLGLSASPGNNKQQINRVLSNCCLDTDYKIDVPVPNQIGSMIHIEEMELPVRCQQEFLEDFIKSEMRRTAHIFNRQAKSLLGVSSVINPEKDVGRDRIKKLREGIIEYFPEKNISENHNLFENKVVAGTLISSFEEYHKWEHIYNLARTESFEAVEAYYKNKVLSSNAKYAQRMVKQGRVDQLLRLTKNYIHPKLRTLEMVAQSLVRRGLQFLIFESNKATAQGHYEYLNKSGIKCGLMLGGNSMKPQQQEEVLEQLEDGQLHCVDATTVLREGFNLSVDVIVNMTPPNSAIDQIQRSGRAGRHARNAEIIYIANEEERAKIFAADRNVTRLGLSKISQFAGMVADGSWPSQSRSSVVQPSLF